jgi:hypothetical protein
VETNLGSMVLCSTSGTTRNERKETAEVGKENGKATLMQFLDVFPIQYEDSIIYNNLSNLIVEKKLKRYQEKKKIVSPSILKIKNREMIILIIQQLISKPIRHIIRARKIKKFFMFTDLFLYKK